MWSGYGIGYGFVPAALPIAGLLWLRARTVATLSAAFPSD